MIRLRNDGVVRCLIFKFVCEIVQSDCWLRHDFPRGTTWLASGQIFMKFDIQDFLKYLSRELEFVTF